MIRPVSVLAVFLTVGCQPDSGRPATDADPVQDMIAGVFTHSAGSWVDLTHAFSESSIYWPTDTQGFELEELDYGVTDGGWFYSSYRYSGAEHGGTHLDAPIHFAQDRLTSDELPLNNLIAPAVVDRCFRSGTCGLPGFGSRPAGMGIAPSTNSRRCNSADQNRLG